MTDLFQSEQQKFVDGFKNNASKYAGEFKIKRFFLDNLATKDDVGGQNIFMTGFKSFWVCDTNNTSFQAKIVVNPKGDSGQALPLKANMSMSFSYPQAGCAIENAAQPGVWIDIVFAFNSDISPGFIQLASSISKATAFFTDSVADVTATAQLLLPANGTRVKAYIENKGSDVFYLGSSAMLADSAFRTKALKLLPGQNMTWENLSGLWVKSGSGTISNAFYLLDESN